MKPKHVRLIALLTVPMLMLASGLPLLAQTEIQQMTVTAYSHDAFQLTPENPTVTRPIWVDATSAFSVSVLAASGTLAVSLVAPNGTCYSVNDPVTETFESGYFPIDTVNTRPGASYLMSIVDPIPGTWSLYVSEPAPLDTPLAVITTMFLNNSTWLVLVGGGETFPLGADIRLALVAFDGTNRIPGLSIEAHLFRPFDPTFTPVDVTFRDDGTGGDEIAGDNIYETIINPGEAGTYQVQATASGVASTGQFSRTAASQLRIVPRKATITGFSDRGIDDNSDGMYDRIGITPSANLFEAGTYVISVRLRASNEHELQRSVSQSFGTGTASAEITFSAEEVLRDLGVDGSYSVAEVRYFQMVDGDLVPADIRYDLGMTAPYSASELQHQRLRLGGGGSAVGVDTNANGLYDFLDISVEIVAEVQGSYRYTTSLTDRNGFEIETLSRSVFLNAGANTLTFRFRGLRIGQRGVDGPYYLSNLAMYGPAGSMIETTAFTTEPFLVTQFEGAPPLPVCELAEGFENLASLVGVGWAMRNNSQPTGPAWFQGNGGLFLSQSGTAHSYAAANSNSTTSTNTISNWLLTPPLVLQNGAQLTFWTRTISTPSFPDRLQVRMSTSGNSTHVGNYAAGVGDFTALLLDVNPTYTMSGYPNAWTQFAVTIGGLAEPTTGRLAFRYFVENGGSTGANSDYIGIDTVSFACVPAGQTPAPSPTPTCMPVITFSETFDSVTAPMLPMGWIATNSEGPAPLWVVSNSGALPPLADTRPNAAFVDNPGELSDKRLESPAISIITADAKLTFRNYYALEASGGSFYDGGALEISINGGAFQDILAAGGSFVAGGYNGTISTSDLNPIGGRQAWSGYSNGFITTIVNLPASAAGGTIVLRWRMGSDISVWDQGWRIDTVSIIECVPPMPSPTPTPPEATPTPTPSPTPTVSPEPTPTASPTPTSTASPTATPVLCQFTVQKSCSTTAGASSQCTVRAGSPANCDTQGKPTSLTFRYTGGGCGASNNPQSGKFVCSGSVNNSLSVNVTTPNGYTISPSTVAPGGTFTVSASSFKADSTFVLQNSGGMETLKIHTSCSQLLETGNVFGDLTLVSFNGQSGGSLVTYTYVVTNAGSSAQSNIYLIDDQLGPLAGPLFLTSGATFTHTVQTRLLTTTTNAASVYVDNGGGPECQASSQPVTVTVLLNCPEWAGAGSVSGKKLTRSIANPTTVPATITGITVSWQSSNGKLLKIKLDGDTVWDKKSPTGATSITIPSSALTTNVNRKTIKASLTRVFTLEFEKNASTNLSSYTLTVNFGNCSLTAPPWQ